MSDCRRVLLAGTGPVSVQLAVLLKKRWNCCVGIVGRESVRSESFFAALQQNRGQMRARIQNEQHRPLAGECRIDHVFRGYGAIAGEWDTVVLAVTTDAYLGVLQQISDRILRHVRCIALISPTLGSGSLVRQYMSGIQPDAEVISFSTYLGDTRWMRDRPSNEVITAGVKKKVYIGSTQLPSRSVERFCELYESLGIAMEAMPSPLEAETRNISLYVHPPLFMNDFTLEAVFGRPAVKKYVYKLYPEGPITQYLIRDMLAAWKEITETIGKLNIRGVNLLKFMIDDNYPVRAESISRHDIDHFERLETIRQQYLLYIRYASLLIDPFSEPDREGKYFDFSAVPIRPIFVNKEGDWDIPRMPKEDYYRIKIIQGIARHVGSDCPTIDRFIAAYERKLVEATRALEGEPLSDAFAVQSFAEDVRLVCSEFHARGRRRWE